MLASLIYFDYYSLANKKYTCTKTANGQYLFSHFISLLAKLDMFCTKKFHIILPGQLKMCKKIS